MRRRSWKKSRTATTNAAAPRRFLRPGGRGGRGKAPTVLSLTRGGTTRRLRIGDGELGCGSVGREKGDGRKYLEEWEQVGAVWCVILAGKRQRRGPRRGAAWPRRAGPAQRELPGRYRKKTPILQTAPWNFCSSTDRSFSIYREALFCFFLKPVAFQ